MTVMSVAGIHLDPSSGSAVLVLKGPEDQLLPTLIGLPEATSIAKELDAVELPRPLTHDLLRDVIGALSASVESVEIIDLREDTFFAEIILRNAAGESLRVDSRPSDAIALALRVNAPILVHEQVLLKTQSRPQEMLTEADKEEWKALLEEMEPEDFGKYKM